MAQVIFSGSLKAIIGTERLTVAGKTLQEIVTNMISKEKKFEELLKKDPNLMEINIFINGVPVTESDLSKIPVNEKDELLFMLPISGG